MLDSNPVASENLIPTDTHAILSEDTCLIVHFDLLNSHMPYILHTHTHTSGGNL